MSSWRLLILIGRKNVLYAGKTESLLLQAVPMDTSLIINWLRPSAKTEATTLTIDMDQVAKEESTGKQSS